MTKMRKRFRIAFWILLVTCAGLLLFAWKQTLSRPPLYLEGRTVMEWAVFLSWDDPHRAPASESKIAALQMLKKYRAQAQAELAHYLVPQQTWSAKLYKKFGSFLPISLRRLGAPSSDTPASTRQVAVNAIGLMAAPLSSEAERALLKASSDSDPTVRARATIILGYLGRNTPANRKAVNASLSDIDTARVVQKGPALFGYDFGPRDLPQTLAALDSPLPESRYKAMLKLEQLSGGKTEAVPLLIKNLDDTNDGNTILAIKLLGTLGPSAVEALPYLERFTNHSIPTLQMASTNAIEKITK